SRPTLAKRLCGAITGARICSRSLMARVRSLCVYCGASAGNDPRHAAAAAELGRLLAENDITLVYGGGRVGLMGIVADATLAAGGQVIGIIPTMLKARELAHPGCTELIAVDTMH